MKKEDKKIPVRLTRQQIAILKAGLKYYLLDDSFGCALWHLYSSDRDDYEYQFKANELYGELNKVCKSKPDFGWCGDIKRLKKILKEEYRQAQQEIEEEENTIQEGGEK